MMEQPAPDNARSAIEICAQLRFSPNSTAPPTVGTLTLPPDSNQRILPGIQIEGVDVARLQHFYGNSSFHGKALAPVSKLKIPD
jgi:hypothetical protein